MADQVAMQEGDIFRRSLKEPKVNGRSGSGSVQGGASSGGR